MENKIELIKSVFGDLLESIKGNNDYFTIELKDDWHNCICGISLNANTEYLEKRLHEIKMDFICVSIKKEKLHHDKAIVKKFVAQFNKEDLTIADMRRVIEFCRMQGIEICYQYDLIGMLSDFRLTEKSIIATDLLSNKVTFNNRSHKDYLFYFDAIKVIESEVN